jgi:hypothetical protein
MSSRRISLQNGLDVAVRDGTDGGEGRDVPDSWHTCMGSRSGTAHAS